MSISVDLPTPARVLAVGAHPDDIEFGCGATLAKWARSGAVVTLCICTDGSKGTWDPNADLAELIERREAEQHAAAEVLRAHAVEFLGLVDGELRDDRAVRAELCAVIRRTEPDVVLSHDAWQPYRLHPDHAEAGLLTMGAIVAARDPHFFPEQGLKPHRPSTLLCFEAAQVHHVEAVEGFVDAKVNALLAHRSQWQSTMGIHEDPDAQCAAFARELHDEARAHGLRAGLRAAEAFSRIDDL